MVSRDRAKGTLFAKRHWIPHVFTDLGALLRSSEIDVVYVGSPNALHREQAVQAAEAGSTSCARSPWL